MKSKEMSFEIGDAAEATIDYSVCFHNNNGDLVGKIDLNSDVVEFEGNASESAKAFIVFVKQYWGEEIFKHRRDENE